MKKITLFCLTAICILSLISCTGKHKYITLEPDDSNYASTEKTPDTSTSENIFNATIAMRKENTLLLSTNDPTGLYILTLDGLDLIDCNESDVRPGVEVAIEYSGVTMETYPARLGDPTSLRITGGKINNICEMYVDIIEELWTTDPGLNGQICAIEILDDTLSEVQKNAIVYEFTNRIGPETHVMRSSYDELVEQGYINEEYLYFEDGALITITTDKGSNSGKKFSFNANKWASGTGAIFFTDCKAEIKDGIWSYELGSFAIS